MSQHTQDNRRPTRFVKLEENHWKVIVEDNGPGYNPLAQNHHHQSRSIQITLDRLAMLSKHYKDRFTLRITNLSETGEGKQGTRVEMTLPVMELVKAIKHDTHSHSR